MCALLAFLIPFTSKRRNKTKSSFTKKAFSRCMGDLKEGSGGFLLDKKKGKASIYGGILFFQGSQPGYANKTSASSSHCPLPPPSETGRKENSGK